MHILITGGCGFVGSNLALKFKEYNIEYSITCFDNLKRRGSEMNLRLLKEKEIDFVHGDIRNNEDFELIEKVDFVIDCSAEPSVLSGLERGQKQLLNINLVGTLNILNWAKSWGAGMIFLSTSRVYPVEALNQIKVFESSTRFDIDPQQTLTGISEKGINESFSLEGYKSIYGASKYASEVVMHEFEHFYNMNIIINRCGVIAGPHQMGKVDQGVMVLWVARHYWKRELSYFGYGGTGKQVRDVLHIDDLFELVKMQILNPSKYTGKVYNAGGGLENSTSLKELTQICQKVVGTTINIASVPQTRIADIKLYVTDNTRIEKESGWMPQKTIYNTVEDVFMWIRQNEKELKQILN